MNANGQAVPVAAAEPGVPALTLLGGIGLLVMNRRRRRRAGLWR